MHLVTVPPARPAPPPSGNSRRRRASATGAHPLLVGIAAAVLAVLVVLGIGLVALLLRGAGRPTPQEVVGSAIPPPWTPGKGGAGSAPPLPPAGAAPALGAPAAAPTPPPPAPDSGVAEDQGIAPQAQPSAAPLEQPPTGDAPPPAPAEDFTPPRLIELPPPEYPAAGQRMGIEGVVVLQVLVAPDGRVLEANPVGERLGMGFEVAARRAAYAARFEPARRNGVPVQGETRIAIRFKLQ